MMVARDSGVRTKHLVSGDPEMSRSAHVKHSLTETGQISAQKRHSPEFPEALGHIFCWT